VGKRIKYIDAFFLFSVFLYMGGLILPLIYTLLLYFKKGWSVLGGLKKPFLGLTCLYIFSLLLSLRFEFFTFGRFAASIHNLMVLLFIPAGYYVGSRRILSKRYLDIFLILIACILCPYILFSLYKDFNLSYGGLLSLFAENKYTRVVFSMPYYLGEWKYSRIQFFAPYPTATAFFIVALNTYRSVVKGKIKIDALDIALLLIVVFTGARFLLVVFVMQLTLKLLFKNRPIMKLIVLMAPLLVLLGLNIGAIILESRAGSNNMRIKIYTESFKMLVNQSPIIGIGIKPKIPEILGIYPFGSHSTLNTILFKTGFLGGIIFLWIYFKTLLKRIKGMVSGFLAKDNERLFIAFSQALFLFAILFDDLDSDEFYAFCFGVVMGLRKL